jgi:hypothetical protein
MSNLNSKKFVALESVIVSLMIIPANPNVKLGILALVVTVYLYFQWRLDNKK